MPPEPVTSTGDSVQQGTDPLTIWMAGYEAAREQAMRVLSGAESQCDGIAAGPALRCCSAVLRGMVPLTNVVLNGIAPDGN